MGTSTSDRSRDKQRALKKREKEQCRRAATNTASPESAPNLARKQQSIEKVYVGL